MAGSNAEPLDANYSPIAPVLSSGNGLVIPQASSSVATDTGTNYSFAVTLVQLADKNKAVAAGTGTTPVVVKASGGYLHSFVVTTTATAAMTFYDNASAASGTALYVTSTTIAAGTVVVLNMPFANGLTVSQASGSAAVTIAYI
jgi:hypothetical protein